MRLSKFGKGVLSGLIISVPFIIYLSSQDKRLKFRAEFGCEVNDYNAVSLVGQTLIRHHNQLEQTSKVLYGVLFYNKTKYREAETYLNKARDQAKKAVDMAIMFGYKDLVVSTGLDSLMRNRIPAVDISGLYKKTEEGETDA